MEVMLYDIIEGEVIMQGSVIRIMEYVRVYEVDYSNDHDIVSPFLDDMDNIIMDKVIIGALLYNCEFVVVDTQGNRVSSETILNELGG